MEHHPYGPSSLRRRILCPGSAAEEAKHPAPPDSEDAARGTRLHHLIATRLRREPVIGATAEDLEIVEAARKFARDCWESMGTEAKPEVLIEERFELRIDEAMACDGSTDIPFGTLDFALVSGGSAIIVDWKTGQKDETSEVASTQIAMYAAMLFQTYGILERVTAYVHNPVTGTTYRETFNREPLLSQMRSDVRELMTTDYTGELHPGDHCQYCRAMGLCAKTAPAEILAEAGAAGVIIPPGATDAEGKALVADEIERLDLERIAAPETVKLLGWVYDAIRDRIRYELEAGREVPGWRLVPSRGSRTATIGDIWEALKGALTDSEILACSSPKVAEIERVYAEKALEGGKVKTLKEGVAEFKRLTDGAVSQATIKKLEAIR